MHLEIEKIDFIYIDVSEAFDSVNYRILIYKLNAFCFNGSLLAWFSSYLKDRPLFVKYKNYMSYPINVTSGISQG